MDRVGFCYPPQISAMAKMAAVCPRMMGTSHLSRSNLTLATSALVAR